MDEKTERLEMRVPESGHPLAPTSCATLNATSHRMRATVMPITVTTLKPKRHLAQHAQPARPSPEMVHQGGSPSFPEH